jgi:protein-L-isoaspartate(D-aspartate) O-methyltransferase
MMQQADVERARFNMVEQQIRTWEVLDQRVLDLLFSVRREDFVPAAYRALAFADMEIPLGHGEKMLQPKLEARILQEVSPAKTDHILEVGTGSGYMTALLAAMGAHVCSVDLVPDFTRGARARLSQHGYSNVTLETGDGASGWGAHGPYDIIVLTGSVPALSEAFHASLKPGGRLFAVVGEPPVMEASLTTCMAEGSYSSISLFETCIPPLKNAHRPPRFVF